MELLGGTGQKCLAVATGNADVAIINFQSSSWDTCAPEALVRAAGGELTDLFGERIIYHAHPPAPSGHGNTCGVLASAPEYAATHRAVCSTMRTNLHVLETLRPWGLDLSSDASPPTADEVMDALRRRRERLGGGLFRSSNAQNAHNRKQNHRVET